MVSRFLTHCTYGIFTIIFLGLSLSLTACGSGSSGGNTPPATPANNAPTASGVSITDNNGGSAGVGDVLTGSYSYADNEGDSEGSSSFRWLRNGIAISGETSASYTLLAADSGTSMTFEVTPVATTGTLTGSAVTSSGLTVTNSPAATVATPSLSLAQSKIFRFNWTDVSGATFYRLLENPDGASGFTQVSGDITQGVQTFDHIVPLYARLNAQYILQTCDTNGCTDSSPLAVSGTLAAAIGYFKASNTGMSDRFGYAVSLSADGNTLAVGSYSEGSNARGVGGNQGDNSMDASGAVYVFTRSGGTWNQQTYLKASNTGAGDGFGRAISLSADGNTLAVGAHNEGSSATGISGNQANNSAISSGAVYVFTRSSAIWSQQTYLKASNTGAYDLFGFAVSLSADGNILAVGAYAEDGSSKGVYSSQNNSSSSSGAVYLFTRSSNTWSQQAYVKASNTGALDSFGRALSLSADGSTLAVGASSERSNARGIGGTQTNNSATGSGAVYVFAISAGIWSQQAYIKASNSGITDQFGWALSLNSDGSTLAVGAYGEASSATGIGGTQADNSSLNSGAVYVFTRSSSIWSQQSYLKASNTDANDRLGYTLSLSADGNILAAGALVERSNASGIGGNQADNSVVDSGAVYLFTRSGGTWNQQAYLKASNTGTINRFSRTLSLSADGNTLAVGADGEESNATGIGGNQADNTAAQSGAVYLY